MARQHLQYFAMFVLNLLNPHTICHQTKGTSMQAAGW
jgi:hypothetical protein